MWVGYRYVGETVSKKLAKACKTMDGIVEASYESLVETDEIGEKIARSIREFIEDEKNIILIEKLKHAGLRFEKEEEVRASSILESQTVVISGTFERYSRNEMKKLIEENGGKNGSSISKKTSLLVAGANMGPSKLKKATDLGVEIIDEADFLKKINFTRFAKSKINTTKDGKIKVAILKGQESFRVQSFVKSNIWTILPQGKTKFKKNEIVDCFLPNHPNKIFY